MQFYARLRFSLRTGIHFYEPVAFTLSGPHLISLWVMVCRFCSPDQLNAK